MDKYFKFEPSIKYVAVELINKDKTKITATSIKKDDIELGLFAGTRTEVDDITGVATIHVCLQQGIKTKAFNVEQFNVLTLEIAHGLYKEELFFQANLPDQLIAMECLNEILEALSDKFMTSTDSKMIKVDKYVEVPEVLAKDTKASVVGTKNSSIYSPGNNNSHNRSCGVSTYNSSSKYTNTTYISAVEKKRLTKPTFFKRVTDVPSKDLLEAMKTNILRIQEGKYTQPEFHELEVDKEVDKEVDTKTATYDDDDYYGEGGAWMGMSGCPGNTDHIGY